MARSIGPHDGEIGGPLFHDVDSFAFGAQLQQAVALVGDVGEPHRLLVQLIAARLDAREVEDLVDEMQQMPAALQDVAGVLGILRVLHRAEHLRLHHLGETEDGVERRAQLVAHGGEEA